MTYFGEVITLKVAPARECFGDQVGQRNEYPYERGRKEIVDKVFFLLVAVKDRSGQDLIFNGTKLPLLTSVHSKLFALHRQTRKRTPHPQ